MISNVLDLNPGGLKIEKEIKFQYSIGWMDNLMKLLSKTLNITLKKFIPVKERVPVKLFLVGIYTLDVMLTSLVKVQF